MKDMVAEEGEREGMVFGRDGSVTDRKEDNYFGKRSEEPDTSKALREI